MEIKGMKRTALLIGGTGLVGGHCLEYLLAEPQYESVTMLVRHPVQQSHPQKSHPKLKIAVINFDIFEEYRNIIKADDIYCAIGTTFIKTPRKEDYFRIDYTYPLEIAKIAIQNGAKRFALVSAMSSNPDSLFHYSRVKGALEKSLSKLPFEGVYIFRPSFLLGKRNEFRIIEKIGQGILWLAKPFLIGSLRKYRSIQAKKVAHAMVLKTLEGERGLYVYLSDQIEIIG